jgi:transcriptional regulator with XRE-family HTH domain
MAATRTERERFGKRLRELRSRRDLTADELGSELPEKVTGQTVAAWERGEWAPKHWTTVAHMEAILEASKGELSSLLGYPAEEADQLEARLSSVEAEISEIRGVLQEMRQLLGGTDPDGPAPPEGSP